MSSFSAVAEIPGRIEDLFQTKELNEAGIYAVNFYALDMPLTVIIDDQLPVDKSGDDYSTVFAEIPKDSSMWVPLIEKAFAKFRGNYQHLNGGDARFGVDHLVPGPSERYGISNDNSLSADDLWEKLLHADSNNDVIQTGFGGKADIGKVGLTGGHAYTLLGVEQLSTGERLVKVRNPWGSEGFTGDWSDGSSKWTDKAKQEVSFEKANDGTFYMSVEDLKTYGADYSVNRDMTGKTRASFLMRNDQKKYEGHWGFCGKKCSRHELTLTSTVDQTVELSVNMWPDWFYTDNECKHEVNSR